MIKRVMLLFLCVAVVLLASGCAGEQETLNEASGRGEVESKAGKATLRVGEAAKVGNTSFTLNGVRQELGDESWAPEEGDMWIVFDCTIENNDSESAFVTTVGPTSTFILYDEDGYSKNTTVVASPKGNLNAEIAPTRKINGEVAFVVDESETEWEFVFAPHGAEGQAIYSIKKSDIK
jgi:hypothetical protein